MPELTNESTLNYRSLLLITIFLLVVSAIPRFASLDALSFEGDEETTAMASKSLALGNGPTLPSGMSYRRAILHTWLNAQSAKLFGINKESSYRYVSALFGTLTIPLLFLLARSLFGFPIALIAATLLAGSEWHILLSREARMYSMLTFFFTGSALSMWFWLKNWNLGALLLAIIMFFGAAVSHQLSLFLLIFWLAPLALVPIKPKSFLIIATVVLAAFIMAREHSKYVTSAYSEWLGISVSPLNNLTPFNTLFLENFSGSILLLLAALTLCAALCFWLVQTDKTSSKSQRSFTGTLAFYFFSFLTSAAVISGNLHIAAITAFAMILTSNETLFEFMKYRIAPLAALIALSLAWLLYAIKTTSFSAGIKTVAFTPFPYELKLLTFMPGLYIVFFAVAAYSLLRRYNSENIFIYSAILSILMSILLIGIAKPWGAMRYFITIYPFVIIVASYGIYHTANRLQKINLRLTKKHVLIISLLITISGILGQHGIPQAIKVSTLEHGDHVHTFKFPNYPDHRSAGEYVKQHIQNLDIIIAEDALQQTWYVDHVDYWLRSKETSGAYLYIDRFGIQRDIYVGSQLATADKLNALNTLTEKNGRIWIITSAETYQQGAYYLDEAQNVWLDNITSSIKPHFIANDLITKVYCIDTKMQACGDVTTSQ